MVLARQSSFMFDQSLYFYKSETV